MALDDAEVLLQGVKPPLKLRCGNSYWGGGGWMYWHEGGGVRCGSPPTVIGGGGLDVLA